MLDCKVSSLGKNKAIGGEGITGYLSGDSTLIWKKDGRMISAGDRIIRKDARMKLLDHSLEISDVTEDDAGEYICNVETFGSPLDQIHTVSVLGKTMMHNAAHLTRLHASASLHPVRASGW